jgi:hypothetical protein
VPKSTKELIEDRIKQVPKLRESELLKLRDAARAYGDDGIRLIVAIENRLRDLEFLASRKLYEDEFARAFFRIAQSYPPGEWISSKVIFDRAVAEKSSNKYVIWFSANEPRQQGVTEVLRRSQHEFPDLERRKDGDWQGAPVFYRVRTPDEARRGGVS